MSNISAFMLNGDKYSISGNTYDVDFLLVGGGGAGGVQDGSGRTGGGGGAGGVISCCCYKIPTGRSYDIVVGCGQCYSTGTRGGDSCFRNFIAFGGGKGGISVTGVIGAEFEYVAAEGSPGGSGGGGGNTRIGGKGFMGGDGGTGYSSSFSGGGGGYTSEGLPPSPSKYSTVRTGGNGIQSDITGSNKYYAYGGGGGGCYCRGYGGTSPGGGGQGGTCMSGECNAGEATTCGSGGGGAGYLGGSLPSDGADGIFVLRYPTACGYNISGGTKYTCGNYTIHCFTSDGTLTVS